MERQHTHSSSSKSIAGTALTWMGILILLGNVGWAEAQVRNFFCAIAGDALGMLPCILLAVCQTAQAYVLDHHGLLGWLLEMLLSLGPLFGCVGGAI